MVKRTERDILIRTVLGEAANQGSAGQAAVLNVIGNRSRDSRWGGSYSDVALAPQQFSTWNKGEGGNNPGRYSEDDPAYIRSGKVVDAFLAGKIPDATGGATHYWAKAGMPGGANPRWASEERERRGGDNFILGGHEFTGKVNAPNLTVSTSGEPPVEKPKVNPFMPIQREVIPALADPNQTNTSPMSAEAARRKAQIEEELRLKAIAEQARQRELATTQQSFPGQRLPQDGVLSSVGPGPTGNIPQELYDMGAIGRRYNGSTPDHVTADQMVPPTLDQSNVGVLSSPAPAPTGQQPMDNNQLRNMANFAIDQKSPPKADWEFDADDNVGGGTSYGSPGSANDGPVVSTQDAAPKKKEPWLNKDRGQMLLAIGSGLLSGTNWASGIGAAGENLMGVNESIAQRQYDLMSQTQGEEARAAALAESRLASGEQNASQIKQMEMKDGSYTGVVQVGSKFVLPDGTDVSDQVVGPVNNGFAAGERGQMTPKQAQAEASYLSNSVGTLRSMDRITETLGDQALGINAVVNNASAFYKTLLGRGLSAEEINQKVIAGDVQGLIGQTREQIVGPGVMTEADAFRVLQAIGGDTNTLSTNPEVVIERLGILKENVKRDYDNRYATYSKSLELYPDLPYQPVEAYTPWQAPDPNKGALDSSNVGSTSNYVKPDDWSEEEWATLSEDEKASLQ